MGEQSSALANDFERVNSAAMQAVEALTPGQWALPCAGECWTVGVVLNHLASAYMDQAATAATIAVGARPEMRTDEQLDAMNDEVARLSANVDKATVLDLLRRNGAAVAEMLRRMDDASLDNAAPVHEGEPPVTARWIVEGWIMGHPADHLASIRKAIEASA